MPSTDLNGDGRDDIIWRNNSTGVTSNWLGTETGGFLVNDAVAADPWAVGQLVAVGDFDNDGLDDTLWRDTNGGIHINFSPGDGAFYFQWFTGFVANVPLTWTVLGAGDFNGDGRDDILWGSNDGRISNWLANGDYTFTINDANAMTSALAEWTVQAIGDFDGTGGDDILVRNASGALDVLFANEDGGFDVDHSDPIAVPLDWQIVGTGDFNGDGQDDILWRHANGTISNWLSSSDAAFAEFVINDANALAAVPLEWQVWGIGDYNGDGQDDILWRNMNNGAVSNWLGVETTGGWVVNDANALRAAPLDWSIQPNPAGAGLWDY